MAGLSAWRPGVLAIVQQAHPPAKTSARLLKQRTKPVNPLPEINVRIGANLLDHFMDSTSHIIV